MTHDRRGVLVRGAAAIAPDVGDLRSLALLAALLAASLLVKAALIALLDGRVYGDVLRSVNFGLGLETGVISITTHVDNTRSFLGPVLNAALYRLGGVGAIKGVNAVAFLALCLTMVRIGRDRFDTRVVLVALAILAFYAGGHRNVAAGELEDNLAALLFAGGLLLSLHARRELPAGVLMGLAFLLKFWVLIFLGALGLVLVLQRRWRAAVAVTASSLLPILGVSLVDDGATVRSLLMTMDRQQGYSSWSTVGFRLLSTGLLPAVAASAWAVVRQPTALRALCFAQVAAYFAYVLLFRDAHAVTFVMMLCLVPAGFLVAEFLVDSRLLGAAPRSGRVRIGVLLAAFAIGNAGIAWRNLYRDTVPVHVAPGRDAKPLADGRISRYGLDGRAFPEHGR